MSEKALERIRIAKDTGAKRLSLSNCALTNIPKQLLEFEGLQQLGLSGNYLSDLSALEALEELQMLDLSNNNLENLDTLPRLSSLQILDLNNNGIHELYPLKDQIELQILDLSSNKIVELTPLSSLKNLQVLDLNENYINDISPLKFLVELRRLGLKGNLLGNLEPLKFLKKLQKLDLSENEISDLLPLASLERLWLLYLQGNQIGDLSPLHSLMKKGNKKTKNSLFYGELLLKDNPLITPPNEVVKQGIAAIYNYFEELEEGEETVYEARLLIIGEAGVGKTTLARKIINPDADMPQDVDTTHGIHINTHTIEEVGKPNFKIHIWDFGGQEIYHSTHQFFLSKRSLYVLVLDGRIEENPHYWMQVQDLLGDESPLLLLLNKKGDIRSQVAFKELLSLYKNLQKPQYEFSLKNDKRRLELFTKSLEHTIRNLPHFINGEKVPRKWVNVRVKLEDLSRDKDFISLEKFREVCSEFGINDLKQQDFLSDFLHSLGAILHFTNEPLLRKTVILNPNWATDAVYKVLDHTSKNAKRRGHFDREELDIVWKDLSYQYIFDELLALMKKFELCYQLPGNREEYIVPALLPKDKPDSGWVDYDQLVLRYTYTFMPKGIVPRLIVRLKRHIKNQQMVWQRGAVFEREDSIAEVTENFRDRYIQIKARGRDRKFLLSIILDYIDEINSSFDFDDRLMVAQLIPCNCKECKKISTPYFFPKNELDIAINKGVQKVQCRVSFDSVSISSLMDHVFLKKTIYVDRTLHLRELLKENKLDTVIKEMVKITRGSTIDKDVIQLHARFIGLQEKIRQGTISFENQELTINSIFVSTQELLEQMESSFRSEMQLTLQSISHEFDDRMELDSSSNTETSREFKKLIDKSMKTSAMYQSLDVLDPFQALIEELKGKDLIALEEYEELQDIHAELKEISTPNLRQKRRWNRWINKVAVISNEIIAKSREANLSLRLRADLEKWIEAGGFDRLLSYNAGGPDDPV